jgi:hypothetical protein
MEAVTGLETRCFLKLNFTGSSSFSLLNNTWKVAGFTTSTITLQKHCRDLSVEANIIRAATAFIILG